jgi:hypothetical protein
MKAIVTSFDQYYVCCTDEDGGWDEVYDPRAATVFSSKKAAQEWVNREPEMGEYLKVQTNIDEHITCFESWLEGGMVRRHFGAPSNWNVNYDPEKHDAMDVLKWNYQYAVEGDNMRVTQDVFELWYCAMHNVFNFIHNFQSFYSLDYKNKYVSFEIMISPDSSFKDFKEEMDMVLDHFEFNHLWNDESLMIDIFDNDCCETRNPQLLMDDRENDKWSIIDLRHNYGGTKEYENLSLKEAFEIIRRNYYYD